MTAHPARRELTAAVLGAVVAGTVALVAGGQAWATVTVERRAPLPPVSGELAGTDVAPLVPAAGLVLLAAAVALLAVRGAGRLVVGLLTAAAGGALVWSAVRVLAGGTVASGTDLPGVAGRSVAATATEISAAWPVLAAAAGVLAIGVGLLTMLRGRGWPGMGRRYERTPATAAPRTDEDRAQLAWNALDRGEDPTDPPPAEQRP